MEYPNSPQLQKWLEKSGWGIAATQDTFVLNDAFYVEQLQELKKNRVREDHLEDRAAFRCLTLNAPKVPGPAKTSEEAIAAQQRQIAERTQQQKEHEAQLLSEIHDFKKIQAGHAVELEAIAASGRVIQSKVADLSGQLSAEKAALDLRWTAALHQWSERVAGLEKEVAGLKQAQKAHTQEIANLGVDRLTASGLKQLAKRGLWLSALAFILMLIATIAANAQQANVNIGNTVTTCGGLSVTVGGRTATTIDNTGRLCADVTGSTVTANLSTTNLGVNITQVGSANVLAGGSGALAVVGAVSSGTTILGGPVLVGGNSGGTATSLSIEPGNTGALVTTLVTTTGTIGQVNVGTFPDNEPFNLEQVNGATVLVGAGTATATLRVVLADADPCVSGYTKGYTAISLTTSSQIITGATDQYIYVCSINLVAAAATNVAVVSGTGTVCATSIGGVFGGTTAATGWNFAANGGIALGSGAASVGRIDTTGENLCILVSAANQTSGAIVYVLAP